MKDQQTLHEKRMHMERLLLEKQRIRQKELLAEEKLFLQQRLAEEREFADKQHKLRERYQQMQAEISAQYDGGQESGAIGGGSAADKVRNWMETHLADPRGAYPKPLLRPGCNPEPQPRPEATPLNIDNFLWSALRDNRNDDEGREGEANPLSQD